MGVYKRMKGLAVEAVLKKNIKRIYVYKPGILLGRFSATSAASVRSKGNWDKIVGCFTCCCGCLMKKVGVQCSHLGAVMVRVAELPEGSVVKENDGKVVIKHTT